MSAKSQHRRLARKYPRKPRDYSRGLDWSNGASDPVQDLHELIYRSFDPIRASTVELVDEDDLDGAVVFKDEDGNTTMWMPRSVYDQFMVMKLP
jgi:hypothetical protein